MPIIIRGSNRTTHGIVTVFSLRVMPCTDRSGMASGPEVVDRAYSRQRKLHGLEENVGAAETELSTDELTEIEDATSKIQVQGGRYSEASERMTNL